MLLTGVVQNTGTGGTEDGDGRPDDRWPLLAERINASAERVDFAMLCEVMDWHRYGHKQLARACEDLDLDVVPLAPSSSGLGTALLYRREVLGRWKRHNPDFADETLHGFAVTAFDVGLPAPLSFVPVHFAPFAAEKATIEAGTVASRGYKYGPYVVLGGDVNYPPASPRSPLPDYSTMRPYNIGARTVRPEPGSTDRQPDRQVTEKLEAHGYVDVAWHLSQKEQNPALLDPTGTDDRIDQVWVSAPVAPAVSGYRLLDSPAGASDHKGLVFTIDTDLIDTSNPWKHR
ncbi:endonuclease/exonuclease/phosphatase family protein [Streptomyces sp. NPDC056244]|uniref:endonuclease/exonuclease/phosphatase family protein n=1 Tax=Streptomyces sp. NPDC056244 TaxID=3345762 RepID=UPI0035D97051